MTVSSTAMAAPANNSETSAPTIRCALRRVRCRPASAGSGTAAGVLASTVDRCSTARYFASVHLNLSGH